MWSVHTLSRILHGKLLGCTVYKCEPVDMLTLVVDTTVWYVLLKQNEEKEVLDLRKLTSLKGPECGSEEQNAVQMVFPNRQVHGIRVCASTYIIQVYSTIVWNFCS